MGERSREPEPTQDGPESTQDGSEPTQNGPEPTQDGSEPTQDGSEPTQDGSVKEEVVSKNPTGQTKSSNVKNGGSIQIDMTADPANEEDKNKDNSPAEVKTRGLAAVILTMLQTQIRTIGLFVFVVLLLCAAFGSGIDVLLRGNEHTRAELQQKLSAAWGENKPQLEEIQKLQLQLNRTLQIKNMEMGELHRTLESNILQLQAQSKISARLKKQMNLLRSILRSNQTYFTWGFCNVTTRQCSRCPIGWKEHDSRCFYLFPEQKEWQRARKVCQAYGGDLAVVSDAEDQAFLTNLTQDFVRQHPNFTVKAVWIGLTDFIREKDFRWVDGSKLHENLMYWETRPNNLITVWDKVDTGQDCIGIRALNETEPNWLKNWDDITCRADRYYICETEALVI